MTELIKLPLFKLPLSINNPGIVSNLYHIRGLIIFDENREKKRQLELEKIKTTEIKLNEEEKCPLCLEYLIVCEFDDECSKKERNIFLLCGHKMCRKCYYSKFKNLSVSNRKCPICRENC